ncbi:hypothetical protein [Rubellicoccus peritrichatus]|uniref:PEP-CTERM protein-sorting domain-containing protein n=1 Tax=Rubellicoccus peritrichatus TaxID=3080537 RepID=A0AAQ3QXR4_9BACT|nr:hypothetical protein [Puniceicoccus sp. CR14]WOO43307.1 hypothetical protein RZN69_09410 [Puniceicoccus sp. CR14]
MIDKRKLGLTVLLGLNATLLSAQTTVLYDPYGDGSIPNNSDINTDFATRQSGTTTSTYTHNGATSGTLISNSDGITSSNNMARLRNNEQTGGASNGFLSLDTDFSVLAGSTYTISFDFFYNQRATESTDQWVSFALGDTSPQGTPAAAAADFGILMRPDGVGGANDNLSRFYRDGAAITADDFSTTPSYISSYVTFVVTVDEAAIGGPLISVTAGGITTVEDFSVGFDSSSRYIAFGSHLGPNANTPATDFADLYIDNVTLTVIPEPSVYASFLGLGALLLIVMRRYRQ